MPAQQPLNHWTYNIIVMTGTLPLLYVVHLIPCTGELRYNYYNGMNARRNETNICCRNRPTTNRRLFKSIWMPKHSLHDLLSPSKSLNIKLWDTLLIVTLSVCHYNLHEKSFVLRNLFDMRINIFVCIFLFSVAYQLCSTRPTVFLLLGRRLSVFE